MNDRQRVWVHNSFLGHAAMMRSNAETIMRSSTSTRAAKETAAKIFDLAEQLSRELKERVDD